MIYGTTIFRDRRDAGQRLAAELQRFSGAGTVVLGLPRGGVPVAFEIAKALSATLDVLLVRKIGAPGHEEVALGAIVDGRNPQLVLNEEIIGYIAPSPDYMAAAKQRQLVEIERRRQLYTKGEPAVEVSGRTVIVADDGIATGATVKAALRGVRQNKPLRLILAVPVAPPETLTELASECDEIVCLLAPRFFHAVSMHYDDFTQTTDEEVVELLEHRAKNWAPAFR